VNGDRKYTDQDWRNYFAMILTNGVFPAGTQLQVLADIGMNVKITDGGAWINGAGYQVYGGGQLLTVPVADGVLDRIDRVVIRSSRTDRRIFATVLEGEPSSDPVAPELVRDADYYDLSLATIYVAAGATEITQADITDTRMDPDVCGFVSSLIRPDTSGWFEQFQSAFEEWFADAQGVLDEDAAGNLLNLINTKADKAREYTATLTAAGWTGSGPYTQTVTVTGIASTDEPIVDVLLSSNNAIAAAELEAWAMVSKITTGTNSITATCLEDKPTVNLNIRIKVVY